MNEDIQITRIFFCASVTILRGYHAELEKKFQEQNAGSALGLPHPGNMRLVEEGVGGEPGLSDTVVVLQRPPRLKPVSKYSPPLPVSFREAARTRDFIT